MSYQDYKIPLLADGYKGSNIEKNTVNKRYITIGILLALICAKNNFLPVLVSEGITCYSDIIFDLTSDVNELFYKNTEYRHILLCFASLTMDSLILLSYIIWIFDWEDWVLFLSVVLFYGFRSIVFSLFQMRFPENYAFDNPGFLSITVSYLVTNDFFFSGHVGLPIILSIYYHLKKQYAMVFFSVLVCLIQGTMMIILRGHYSIDILFGLILAYHAVKIAIIINPFFKKVIKLNDNKFSYANEENVKPKKYIILKDNTDEN